MAESRLLIVEDNPADTTHYMRLLEEFAHGFGTIQCLTTLSEAKHALQSNDFPACCLLDFNLPDGSALSYLSELQSKALQVNCPIVVITGQQDTKSAVELLKLGVQDYVVKDSLTTDVLERTIVNAMRKWELERQLEQMAMYDSLTQLANRGLFVEKLEQTLSESERYNIPFAVLLIDLDKFKNINDIYGHDAGDAVLQAVGKALYDSVRDSDTAGRLGGDEFAVILHNVNEAAARKVAQKILNSLTLSVEHNNITLSVTPSVGVSSYPFAANDAKSLLKEADIALYQAKATGRSKVVCFKDNWKVNDDKLSLAKEALPQAIENNELEFALQAVVYANEPTKIFAIEALTHWKCSGDWVDSVTILNWVMELGLDSEFHLWLLDNTFNALNALQKHNPELLVSINLPANICHNASIRKLIYERVAYHQVKPQHIILEVCEGHLISEPSKAKACLLDMREQGFKIAIDDFGSGYSSLEYLTSLPIDMIKIDQKYFIDYAENADYHRIIKAISALSHALSIDVIAVGIESATCNNIALDSQCDYIQGYHTGKPKLYNSASPLNLNDLLSHSQ